jgi:hypothetical protein
MPEYTQPVQVPVEPLPAVLKIANWTFGAVPHWPMLMEPACAVSEVAASVAWAWLYVLMLMQS